MFVFLWQHYFIVIMWGPYSFRRGPYSLFIQEVSLFIIHSGGVPIHYSFRRGPYSLFIQEVSLFIIRSEGLYSFSEDPMVPWTILGSLMDNPSSQFLPT